VARLVLTQSVHNYPLEGILKLLVILEMGWFLAVPSKYDKKDRKLHTLMMLCLKHSCDVNLNLVVTKFFVI